MSSLLSAELVATCNALGYFDVAQNKYYADNNTLESVKDLIRYLRRDGDGHDIRRQLGETKVVQTDLLPLMKNYWEETDLFDVLLRLLVNLTSPALILWHEEPPTERATRNRYLQIEEHLRLYKQAFADDAIWAVLSTRISKILEMETGERGDENGLIIERILILIRNILYVPADPDAEKRPDNDASIHDQVLWALHQSGMLDLILYIASSSNEQAYYMHILEILSFMLREQTASELANAALQRSQTEKIRDEAELLAIRHRESNKKQQKVKQYTGTRHSRFGGTFVVKSVKSITDNELIYHKPLNKIDSLNFDVDKQKSKTPKNRVPIQTSTGERRSAFSIRLFLKEFCVEFLNGAYNTIMYHVKQRLSRSKGQQHDESYYLWALRFFMEFNRCYKFEVKLVSETMSVQAFHYAQQQMENYFDMISSDKKKFRLWARRLHLALLAYRELLMTICAMDKSTDETVRDSAKVIKSNVFYVLEYRELVLTLLVTFDELKMSQEYLKDLLETQHVFLKMLESYCGGKSGRVIVQSKSKPRKKKKAAAAPAPIIPEFNLNTMWDEASHQVSAVLEGNLEIPKDVVPFDPLSDTPVDDQKADAMKNIQRKLRAHEFEYAIGLLRASREVWPEDDCFGSPDMTVEEEFTALRDIFLADLGENDPPEPVIPEPEDDAEEDEEDEYEESMQISESDLKFEDFSKRLAHPKIVRACGLALANFEKNTALTNHCIAKLLHRIAFDCKMSTMVFQVSIFRTFQKIYEAKMLPQNKELVKFATYIIRQFFHVAAKNSSVYMEALFWKSSRDAYDIEEGYGSYQEKSKASTKAWTELEEDEIRKLFMEHQEKQVSEDIVDWILNNLIDNTKTRRNVLKKLKEMYLLTNYKGAPRKSGVSGKLPKEWGADEEAQLQELYDQFRDAMDPLSCIMDRLDVPRPKNRIIEKLLVMGLVQDRKELRKKRTMKSQGDKSGRAKDSDGTNTSDSEDGLGGGGGGSSPHHSHGKKAKQSYNPQTKKKSRSKPGKTSNHVRASSGELARSLISLVDAGMSEAIEWIKESLSDAIEDMENEPDTDGGVPLVPIMDYSVTAMENEDFQKMLRGLGMNEPADEQEIYWRIPSTTAYELKSHCDLLSKAIDKTLTVPEETIITPQAESSDDDVFDKLRKFTKEPEKNPENSNMETDKIDKLKNIKSLIKKTAKAKPSTTELLIVNEPAKQTPNKKQKRRIQMADSSDEEDKIDVDMSDGNQISWMPSRIRDFSDSDTEPTVRTILDLDDSNDAPTNKPFKSMRLIESDSDEDVHDSTPKPNTSDTVNNESNTASNNELNAIEEDDNESNVVGQEGNELNNSPVRSKKTRRLIDSDEEESDKENSGGNAKILEDAEGKRNRSVSDSDSEKPRPKRSRVIDSDDDD